MRVSRQRVSSVLVALALLCLAATLMLPRDASHLVSKTMPPGEAIRAADPMTFDGNVAVAALPGAGTPGDPFRLQHVSIDANGASFALNISNVNVHVLVQHSTFKNTTNGYGIALHNVTNVRIENCTIINATGGSGAGIHASSSVSIVDSTFTSNSFFDIYIESSRAIEVRNNTLGNGGLFVQGESIDEHDHEVHDTTSNGKPVLYVKHARNQVLGNIEASQVFCINSTGMVIANASIAGTSIAMATFQVDDSLVENLTLADCTMGMFVKRSSRLTFKNCTTERIDTPVYGDGLNGSVLSMMHFFNDASTGTGITLVRSNDNIIQDSIISGFMTGIRIQHANHSVITSSNVSLNGHSGINVNDASGTRITNSLFSGNAMAITLQAGATSTVVANNEFIDNNLAYPDEAQASDVGSTNEWDDGTSHGNFWSNHPARYPGATATINGTWDMPYMIEGSPSHVDRHPLVNGSRPRAIPNVYEVYCQPDKQIVIAWTLQDVINGSHYSFWENGTRVSPWVGWNGKVARVEHAFTKPLEGTWDVEVRVNNSRGVLGNPSKARVVVDGTPPVITINRIDGTSLQVVVADANAIVQVLFSWDDAANQTLLDPRVLTVPTEKGLHVLRVHALDMAGNWGTTTYELFVDEIPGEPDVLAIVFATTCIAGGAIGLVWIFHRRKVSTGTT